MKVLAYAHTCCLLTIVKQAEQGYFSVKLIPYTGCLPNYLQFESLS